MACKEDYSDAEHAEKFYEENRENGISLCISKMSYTYHNGTKVFMRADFEAHPHEIVALVGPSGEGKTTLLRIMLALLHIQSGDEDLVGAKTGEVLTITPAARRLFSYVPQGNTMFSGTIAENMRNVRPDATDEEIKEVLIVSCAWEFVQKLPDGIYSKVGERGGRILRRTGTEAFNRKGIASPCADPAFG